jgi:hypothetical protein
MSQHFMHRDEEIACLVLVLMRRSLPRIGGELVMSFVPRRPH